MVYLLTLVNACLLALVLSCQSFWHGVCRARVVVCCDFCVLKATSTSLLKKQPQDLKTWSTKIPIEFLPRTLGKVKSIDEKVELNS